MRTKGKWITIIIAVVVLGLLLSVFGCAQTTTAPATSPAPKPTQAPASTPTAAPAKVYTMKVSGYGGATGYPPRIILERFMDMVKERSKGQIKFEYFPGGSLYAMPDAGNAITSGVVQIANTTNSYYEDKLKGRAQTQMSPMTFDWKKFNQNYRKSLLPWYQQVAGAAMNWKMLWYPEHGTTNIISRVAMKTPADFKGKLIRTTASQKRALELIKASPVPMSDGDVFEALQRGTVDASTGSISSAISLKWIDVAPYVIITDLYPASISAVMPLDYYNSLPADLRKIIDDAAAEADNMISALVDEANAKDLKTLQANPKVQIIDFTQAQRVELGKMVAPFHDEMKVKFGKDWEEFMQILAKDNLGL